MKTPIANQPKEPASMIEPPEFFEGDEFMFECVSCWRKDVDMKEHDFEGGTERQCEECFGRTCEYCSKVGDDVFKTTWGDGRVERMCVDCWYER